MKFINYIGTFDVQEIQLSQNSSELCLKCIFSYETKAKGCIVFITNSDSLQTMTVKILRLRMYTYSTQCATLSDIGNYHMILAYDWEEDGSVSLKPAVIVTIMLNATTRFGLNSLSNLMSNMFYHNISYNDSVSADMMVSMEYRSS